jgi:hypothetical protein
MRIGVLTGLAALMALSVSSAPAEQAREAKPSKSATPLPRRPNVALKSCAEYGPGFVRVEGSSTCIKIGGSVGVGVGGSR